MTTDATTGVQPVDDRPASSGDAFLPVSEHLVPGWLQRVAAYGWRLIVTLLFGLVIVQAMIVLSTVTVAIVIALIIAATFAPYVKRLRDRGWSRTKAAGGVSLLALGAVTLAAAILAIVFLPYIADVISTVRAGGQAVQSWLDSANMPRGLSDLVGLVIEGVRSIFTTAASQIIAPIAAFVTSLILGGFTVFFLLQDGDRAWAWMVDPVEGWRADEMTRSGRKALDRVGGYLRGTTILAAINAITALVFMFVLGIPSAGPLAVLVFLGAYVPYIGGLITTLIILLVAVGTVGSTAAFLFLILVTIRNLIVSNVVRPQIYGRTLDIHPALVLIALPAGAALFGVVGLFAALPVLAFVLAIGPSVIKALGLEPDEQPVRPSIVPIWLDRLGQWSWRALVVVALLLVVIATAIRLPLVVIPVVLGIVLAATLDPAADALRRRGWPRGRAALVATLGTMFIILSISFIAIAMMVGPLDEMLSTSEQGASQGVLGQLGVVDVVHALRSGALQQAQAFIAGISSFAIILLLATLLTFYLLRDGEAAGRAAVERFGGRGQAELQRVGERAVGVLGGYMIATGAISLFGAGTQFLIMVVLGLPLALPIAVLSFFLGFIPYIGSFLATGLAFLVTVAAGSTTDIAIMAIWTIVFNIAQGNFVAPLVYGRAVSLHPAVVLLAIPAGNAIAGVMGMFLVVPFLGVVAVSWRTILHAVDPGGDHAADVIEVIVAKPPDPGPSPEPSPG
jgi:putative heme transporter